MLTLWVFANLNLTLQCYYKTLRFVRNTQGGGVICYVRNDLSYNALSFFPRQIENIFFEILLPKSKLIIVRTIYCLTSQGNFFEVLNDNMNKIDPMNNETYIFGDLNMFVILSVHS